MDSTDLTAFILAQKEMGSKKPKEPQRQQKKSGEAENSEADEFETGDAKKGASLFKVMPLNSPCQRRLTL